MQVILIIFIASLASLVGLFLYQEFFVHKKLHIHETLEHRDPLSKKELEKIKIVTVERVRKHGRTLTIILLRLTIRGKKIVRRQFDKAIVKLSKMAFPKEELGNIEPNKFIEAVKNDKE